MHSMSKEEWINSAYHKISVNNKNNQAINIGDGHLLVNIGLYMICSIYKNTQHQ